MPRQQELSEPSATLSEPLSSTLRRSSIKTDRSQEPDQTRAMSCPRMQLCLTLASFCNLAPPLKTCLSASFYWTSSQRRTPAVSLEPPLVTSRPDLSRPASSQDLRSGFPLATSFHVFFSSSSTTSLETFLADLVPRSLAGSQPSGSPGTGSPLPTCFNLHASCYEILSRPPLILSDFPRDRSQDLLSQPLSIPRSLQHSSGF